MAAAEVAAAAKQTPEQPVSLPLPGLPSLYVGDLHPSVTESDLLRAFSQAGHLIASLRLCRDKFSGQSLCYAYVNFHNHDEACSAMDSLNHTFLKGRRMRIMWSQRNPCQRKTGVGNLFVKNLNPSLTSTLLQNLFSKYGTILSCKVAEEDGKSKGFGFVQFDSEDSAMAALSSLHGTVVEGNKLYVNKFIKKTERVSSLPIGSPTNLYVKNFGGDVTEDCLWEKFSEFGKILSVAIMKDDEGKSKGFGFVNFVDSESATKAVESLDGSLLGSNTLYVARAQKKAVREELLRHAHRGVAAFGPQITSSNLYVKHLHESIDDIELKEYFSSCGRITSAKVIRHPDGMSRGYGFVCYTTPEEAMRALSELDGTVFMGNSIYVAVANRKEEPNRSRQQNYSRPSPPQPQQPFSWNPSTYVVPPYFNCPAILHSHPQSPILHSISYQHPGATNSSFPFAADNNKMNYSTHDVRGSMPAQDNRVTEWAINSKAVNVPPEAQDRLPLTTQRQGIRKKHGQEATTSAGSVWTRTSKSKRNSGKNLYPLIENIEPENDWNAVSNEGWDNREEMQFSGLPLQKG